MKCAICHKPLLYTDLGWIHEPETECSELDGMMMYQDVRIKWNEKYPKPKESYLEIKKHNENLLEQWKGLHKQNKKLKTEVLEWKNKTKQLRNWKKNKLNEDKNRPMQKLKRFLKNKKETHTNETG